MNLFSTTLYNDPIPVSLGQDFLVKKGEIIHTKIRQFLSVSITAKSC